MKSMRRFGVAMAALGMLLSACGGGGDGDGGGGGSGGISVSVSRSALTFVGLVNQPANSEAIQFSISGGSGTYYGRAEPDVPSRFSWGFTPTSDTTATVTVTPSNNFGVPPGSVSGTINFKLCRDIACTQVAWQRALPYTSDIFGVNVSSLSITGSEGVTSAAQTITVTPADTARRLNIVASSALTPWLFAARSSDSTFSVTASGAGLAPGSHQGQVDLYYNTTGNGSLRVPVSFTVGNGTIAPPSPSIDFTVASTTANSTGSFPVAFTGGQTPPWTASSDQPWLVLTTTAGTGGGSAQYRIDSTRLGSVPNWTSAQANVTLSATGLTPVSFPVTLNKRLPEVFMASPNPLAAGRASTVKVSGRGFNQLTASRTFQLAGVTGVVATVTSDTSAVLTVPATTAGQRIVSIPNAAGLSARDSQLVTLAVPTLAYAAVATTGEKRASLFDASRTAVFAVSWIDGALVRYRYNGSSWVTTTLPVATIGAMALSPDKRTLYVSSGVNTLLEVDPDTMQIRTSRSLDPPNGLMSFEHTRTRGQGWAISNDLKLWFGSDASWSPLSYYDIVNNRFGSISEGMGSNSLLTGASFAAPADGSRMFVSQSGISPAQPSYLYSPATGALSSPTLLPMDTPVQFSENGSRMLANETMLYDGTNFALLGQTPPVSGIRTLSVLSASGTRIYSLVTASHNTLVVSRVDVYDTTQLSAGTTYFVKLGEIAVSDRAGDCSAPTSFYCEELGSLNVSPYGNALFWVGNTRLVVLPIPGALATSPLSVPTQLQAAR